MNKSRLCVVAMGLLLLSSKLSAQNNITHSKEDYKETVNFTDIANYYKEHPTPVVRMPLFDEDEEVNYYDNRPEPDPSLVHVHRGLAREINPGGGVEYALSPSNTPTDTFLSSTSNGSSIPPDTHGAVDSVYCVTAINSVVRIQKRDGTAVSSVALDNWWGSMMSHGTGGQAFDPRVHYDQLSGRWVMVTFAYGQTGYCQIMLAVSTTSNPTGTWYRYKVLVDGTGATWLDFPNIGINQKWITITGNYFSNGSGGATNAALFIFDKSKVMSGTGAPYTKINDGGFTLCPAITYDQTTCDTEANMFVVDVWNPGTGKLRLRKITGAVGSESLSAAIGYPTATSAWGYSGGSGDFGKQQGTTNKVNVGDNRITNLTFRNHKLWCSHTVFLPASAPTRSSVMWWQIDTTGTPLQNGKIDDPTGVNFYAYPSIAVNQSDDALIGFANLGTDKHNSAAYAMRYHTDPIDSMRPKFIYRHGKATYYQTFGGGQNRWGDYSATCVDPINNNDFWTIQESVPATPANYWDVWWAHITMATTKASFTQTLPTLNAYVVDTFKFNGVAPTGSTYSWDFGSSAVPSTSTVAGPVPVKWTTAGRKIVTLTVTAGGTGGTSTSYTQCVNVNAPSGVNELNALEGDVNILPNPNNGSFDVMFANAPSGQVLVKLINIQGQVVYNQAFNGGNKLSVVTGNIAPGVYIANIIADGGVYTQKLTIER